MVQSCWRWQGMWVIVFYFPSCRPYFDIVGIFQVLWVNAILYLLFSLGQRCSKSYFCCRLYLKIGSRGTCFNRKKSSGHLYQSNILLHYSSASYLCFCSYILFLHEADIEWWTGLLAFIFEIPRALTIPLVTSISLTGDKRPATGN